MNKIEFIHLYPPSLTTIKGKKYLVPGWIEVDNSIVLEDILHIKPFQKKWEFVTYIKALRGKSEFRIEKNGNILRCNCSSFKQKNSCGHLDFYIQKNL